MEFFVKWRQLSMERRSVYWRIFKEKLWIRPYDRDHQTRDATNDAFGSGTAKRSSWNWNSLGGRPSSKENDSNRIARINRRTKRDNQEKWAKGASPADAKTEKKHSGGSGTSNLKEKGSRKPNRKSNRMDRKSNRMDRISNLYIIKKTFFSAKILYFFNKNNENFKKYYFFHFGSVAVSLSKMTSVWGRFRHSSGYWRTLGVGFLKLSIKSF